MPAALAAGFGLGFLVAAQVGPIWLLCARSVLRGRFAVGVAIGAGAAVVDALYAGLGAAGATALLRIDAVRLALGIAGACILAAIGLRTLHGAFRVRLGGESADEVGSPRRAFLTSVGATASNPMTIASWAGAFSAASTAALAGSPSAGVVLVAGVGGSVLGYRLSSTPPRAPPSSASPGSSAGADRPRALVDLRSERRPDGAPRPTTHARSYRRNPHACDTRT
jgi:putative LysE/RhtB family amino acid efflux pump